ncbi:hypothetical protein K1719_046373 [Acacia pycnantha]|nr:hypothetical protein K1719_046373 [Acacia pycnantha]
MRLPFSEIPSLSNDDDGKDYELFGDKILEFGQFVAREAVLDEEYWESQDNSKEYAAMFAPFWNEIIKSLRGEDFISNRASKAYHWDLVVNLSLVVPCWKLCIRLC